MPTTSSSTARSRDGPWPYREALGAARQEASEGAQVAGGGQLARRASALERAQERGLDLRQRAPDLGRGPAVTPRQLDRRVRHQAAGRPAPIERPLHPEAEELPDRLDAGAGRLERLEELAGHHALVAVQARRGRASACRRRWRRGSPAGCPCGPPGPRWRWPRSPWTRTRPWRGPAPRPGRIPSGAPSRAR